MLFDVKIPRNHYVNMVRKVEATRPLNTMDYGFFNRNYLQNQIDGINHRLTERLSKEERDRLIGEKSRLIELFDKLNLNAGMRRENEEPEELPPTEPMRFRSPIEFFMNERAKQSHLNGEISHERMLDIGENILGGDKDEL